MFINYNQSAQIILNITLISTMIGVLFFTYGKDVEKKIVQEQSEYIAETIANDIKIFLPLELRKSIVDNMKVPDMSEADADVEEVNNVLLKQANMVLGILFAVGIAITLGISWAGKVNIYHVIIESIVILVVVVMTEILFLNIIARNYKIADPNFVKSELMKSVKDEFQLRN